MIYAQENLPLEKPGIYQIRNIDNGMKYIGISANVLRRASEHQKLRTTTKKIRSALKENPTGFVFEPIFYLLSDVDYEFLMGAERTLIKDNCCVRNGYNARTSSGSSHAAGDEFAASIRNALAKPAEKARRSAASKAYKARPGVKSAHALAMRIWHANNKEQFLEKLRASVPKMTEIVKAAMARPEVIEKMRAGMANPESIARHKAAMRRIGDDPEVRRKRSEGMRRVWAERKAFTNDATPVVTLLAQGKVTVAKENTK